MTTRQSRAGLQNNELARVLERDETVLGVLALADSPLVSAQNLAASEGARWELVNVPPALAQVAEQ